MKRLIALLLCIFISLSLFTSCDKLLNMSSSGDFSEESSFDSGFDFDDDSGLNNDSSYTEDSSHKDSSFGDSSSNGDSSSDDKEEGLEFITSDSLTVEVGSTYQLEWVVDGDYLGSVEWSANNSYASVSPWGEVLGYSAGSTTVTISNGYLSDSITIEVVNGQSSSTNPYLSVNQTSFYANYTPAKNLLDAQYRSQAYLMSGDISDQDQAPTIANNRPIEGDKYLKNSKGLYSTDKKVYYVLNSSGELALEIYKGGAYVTLEEVAAYLFAFNEIPANYTSSKSTKPSTSKWGKYLRLNHSKFSGDTSRYPYEPVLPNISGCGGTYQYYELDIGTTGTTAGEGYAVKVYNDGSSITRGAARIVYSNSSNGSAITDLTKKYLFYTYNHYNDFQEYLNYYNGWGEMFGNITGGGTLSSKYDCNPTPYEEIKLYDFTLFSTNSPLSIFENYLAA